MSSGKDPDKSACSYMDGIPVKISEKFKPPGKVTLPLSVHRLLNSTSTREEYDFSLEHAVLDKLEKWKKHLKLQKEERLKNIAEEENWSKMLEETMQDLHIKEVAPAHIEVSSPTTCDPVLAHHSSDRNARAQASTAASIPTSDSRYPLQAILTPVPMSYSMPVVQTSHTAFNISDFEADTSSPFDNMELKTLNDMEELAHVLQPATSSSNGEYYQSTAAPSYSAAQQPSVTTNTYAPIRHNTLPSVSTPYVPTSGASMNHPIQQLAHYNKTLIGVHPHLNGYAPGYSAFGSVEQQQQPQQAIQQETFPYMPVSATPHYPFTSAADTSVIPGRTFRNDQPAYNYVDRKPLPQNSVPQYSFNMYSFESSKPWLARQSFDQHVTSQPATSQPATQDMSSLVSSDKGNLSLMNSQLSNGPDFAHELGEIMLKKKVESKELSQGETSHSSHPQIDDSKSESAMMDQLPTLSSSAQQFVEKVAEMGFPLSRVARAYTTLDDKGKSVVEYLLSMQSLMERGYSEKQVEDALAVNNNDPVAAQQFLGAQAQLLDLGFPAEKVVDALVKFKCDRDKALEFLIT